MKDSQFITFLPINLDMDTEAIKVVSDFTYTFTSC